MSSRLGLSALFILIAAMVLASQGRGLLKKINLFPTSWTDKLSETRSLLLLYRSCAVRNEPHGAGALARDSRTISINFPDAAHCLDSQARALQHMVLNLIKSDHQGE
jgi:hypothetical protein